LDLKVFKVYREPLLLLKVFKDGRVFGDQAVLKVLLELKVYKVLKELLAAAKVFKDDKVFLVQPVLRV